MKIEAAVSAGIVLVRNDGTPELVPFQVMDRGERGTILRLGKSTLFFTAEGKFDGTEHVLSKPSEIPIIKPLLDAEAENYGKAPATAYFAPGSRGYELEVAAWPETPEPMAPTWPTKRVVRAKPNEKPSLVCACLGAGCEACT